MLVQFPPDNLAAPTYISERERRTMLGMAINDIRNQRQLIHYSGWPMIKLKERAGLIL
jgi:hypothetical protein